MHRSNIQWSKRVVIKVVAIQMAALFIIVLGCSVTSKVLACKR